jgi:hypothetical protein
MGAILYEAISGRTPFDGETAGELLMKIMSSDPPPIRTFRPEVPSLLADCIGQAMARDREHRFLDARVFRRALQSAAEASAISPAAVSGEGHEAKPVANANANVGWGDFEGLSNRSNRPPPIAATARAISSAPARTSVSQPPPRAASGPVDPRAASGPFGPRAASGPVDPRATSGPLDPRAASGPLDPRAASGPLDPRAASGPLGPRAASGPLDPRVGSARPDPRPAAARPRAASGPLGQRVAAGAPTPTRAASGPLARASQPRPELDDVPLMSGAANDGPMLGEHPLDALAGSSALDLEVDYGPGGHAPASRRSPMPAQVKRPGMTGHSTASIEDRKRRSGAGDEHSRGRFILPVLLLLIVIALLIAPGLFSAAPPDQADAIRREARNPATRDSDRHLSTAEPTDRPKASPALRALRY